MAIVEVDAPVDRLVSIHISMCMSRRRWTRTAGCWVLRSFPTTPAGYHTLAGWLDSLGTLERVGVEGTGTYGAGLARHLRNVRYLGHRGRSPQSAGASSQREVRRARRDRGGTRRAVGSNTRARQGGGTGTVEALRALLVAKRSARFKIRIKTATVRHLVITAPDELRARLGGSPPRR